THRLRRPRGQPRRPVARRPSRRARGPSRRRLPHTSAPLPDAGRGAEVRTPLSPRSLLGGLEVAVGVLQEGRPVRAGRVAALVLPEARPPRQADRRRTLVTAAGGPARAPGGSSAPRPGGAARRSPPQGGPPPRGPGPASCRVFRLPSSGPSG